MPADTGTEYGPGPAANRAIAEVGQGPRHERWETMPRRMHPAEGASGAPCSLGLSKAYVRHLIRTRPGLNALTPFPMGSISMRSITKRRMKRRTSVGEHS